MTLCDLNWYFPSCLGFVSVIKNVYDPHDLHVNQLYDNVGVKFLKHCILIQLMMCIRNTYINQSLPLIHRDMVTRGI